MTSTTWTWDGSRLARLREARGLSQRELGERMGGALNTMVSQWETGYRQPNADTLVKLARALDVSVDELLGVGS